MGLFEHFPYTNFHDLNLDWLIEAMKKLGEEVENYDAHIEESVDEWLAAHPEYVTTVVDGSLTLPKFAESLKMLTVNDYVTPEMFGAVGDGMADDTAAVQSAINDSMKTVVLIGTYRITAKLDAASNKMLYGLPGATLRWDNVVGATSLFSGSNLSNIEVENITFDFGAQLELHHSISLFTSSGLKFIGCVFKNSFGYATRFNGSSNILIKDCTFEDITGAAGNPGGAIYGQDMSDLTVTGCRCKNLGDHFVYSAGVTEAKNIIISDCHMETCGVNGLTSGSAITLYANTHDVTITNCIIDSCREGIYAGVYSSYLTLPSKVSVSNCIFKNIILNAMTLFGISTSNRIKQFTMDNCQIDTAGQDGISIRHAERFQMNNIIIDKSVRMGLEVSDTTASMFSQFQITENRDNGVLVSRGDTGASNYNIFSDFYITAATNAGSGAIGFYLRLGDYNVLNSIRVFSYPLNYRKGGLHNIWSNDSGEPSVTRSLTFTNDITAIEYHNVGDVVFNSAPTAGAPAFWVCTAAGSPGTMKPVATIS